MEIACHETMRPQIIPGSGRRRQKTTTTTRTKNGRDAGCVGGDALTNCELGARGTSVHTRSQQKSSCQRGLSRSGGGSGLSGQRRLLRGPGLPPLGEHPLHSTRAPPQGPQGACFLPPSVSTLLLRLRLHPAQPRALYLPDGLKNSTQAISKRTAGRSALFELWLLLGSIAI